MEEFIILKLCLTHTEEGKAYMQQLNREELNIVCKSIYVIPIYAMYSYSIFIYNAFVRYTQAPKSFES